MRGARRARQDRGERPDARCLWFAPATWRTPWRMSRLPSARRRRRRCPCRVSARLAVVMRALRSEAEAGARVGSARDCSIVVLAPPLDPAGSIRANLLSDHQVTMLGDRARRRDGHSVHCIEGCVTEPSATMLGGVTATRALHRGLRAATKAGDEPPPYIESRESRDRVTEPRHRAARKRVLGCVPTICRYGRRPRPTSRVESRVLAGLP